MKGMRLVYSSAEHVELSIEDATPKQSGGMSGMLYVVEKQVQIQITVGDKVHSVIVPRDALISGLKAL